MTREIEPSTERDWDDHAPDVIGDLDQLAAKLDGGDHAPAGRQAKARLNWRTIEEIREQQLLRSQLEDFDHYVV